MTSGLNCSQMWRSKLFRSKQVYHLNESASAREIIHPIIHLRARNTAFVERPETQTFLFPHAWHIIIGLWADFSEAFGDAIRQNGC